MNFNSNSRPGVAVWTCVALAVIVATVSGCRSSLQTSSDFDPSADMNRFKRFNFEQGMPFAKAENEKIVREMVAINLIGKGFTQVDNQAEADFHVFLFPRLEYGGRVDWYTTGYTPWWGGWGGYMGVAATYTDIPVGGLLVDFVDNENDRLFWRSSANTVLKDDPVRNAKIVMKAIDAMLLGFPPTPAK